MTDIGRPAQALAGAAVLSCLLAGGAALANSGQAAWTWVERLSWVAGVGALALSALLALRNNQQAAKAAENEPVRQESFTGGDGITVQASGTPTVILGNQHVNRTPYPAAVLILGVVLAVIDLVLILPGRGPARGQPPPVPTPSPVVAASVAPYLVHVDVDADVDTTGRSSAQAAMFALGTFPEDEAPDSAKCNTWYAWSKRHGGVDWGSTHVAFTVSATKDPVRVHGVRIHREPLERLARGDAATCRTGEQPTFSYLSVNLDDATSNFHYPDTDGVLKERPFALEVMPMQKSDRVLVDATAENCYCSWTLELRMEVGGRELSHIIDHKGRPFVTAPKAGEYQMRRWDAAKRKWCVDMCA